MCLFEGEAYEKKAPGGVGTRLTSIKTRRVPENSTPGAMSRVDEGRVGSQLQEKKRKKERGRGK